MPVVQKHLDQRGHLQIDQALHGSIMAAQLRNCAPQLRQGPHAPAAEYMK